MSTCFSVQQIKYDLLAYIKEFDPNFSHWMIGISDDPKVEMEDLHGVDLKNDLWIFKPAMSDVAANNILHYFTGTLGCYAAPQLENGNIKNCVFTVRIDPLKPDY